MNLTQEFLSENNIGIKQNTEEWHEWRKKHIGASDVPAIMGTSDYSDPYKYWLTKTNQLPAFEGNYATERGKALESTILALFTERTGISTKSATFEYEAWPVLSCSLDGWNDDLQYVVECKAASKDKHELALQGIVPKTYEDQVFAQLLVTGGKKAYYVSYHDGFGDEKALAIVEVYPNQERQQQILEKCKTMWECIQNMTAPADVCIQPELHAKLETISYYKNQIKIMEELLSEHEDEIKRLMKADKVICGDYTLSWTSRKGSVDYSKIEILKEIDLDKYRKPDSRVFSIKKKGK